MIRLSDFLGMKPLGYGKNDSTYVERWVTYETNKPYVSLLCHDVVVYLYPTVSRYQHIGTWVPGTLTQVYLGSTQVVRSQVGRYRVAYCC